MKKSIALVLILMLVMALLPMDLKTAGADGETSGQCGDNLYWSFDEETGTLTITDSGDMYSFRGAIYPQWYDKQPWESMVSQIETIVLPDGLTSIGDCAFYECTGVTSVTIPDSVTSIGEEAFSGCTGLTSVTIPDSVISIGVEAFYGCTGLTSVTIPDSVTSIGVCAFDGC